MADNVFSRTFFQPIYTAAGVPIAATDVISVLLNAADGTHPLQNITVKSVSADGRTIYYENDATNQYARPGDIFAVAPAHQIECPAVQNIGLVAVDDLTTEIADFEINGVVTTGPYALTLAGAVLLQDAMNAALAGNGAVTVVYVDTGTDYFRVYVMGTTATIEVDGVVLETLV